MKSEYYDEKLVRKAAWVQFGIRLWWLILIILLSGNLVTTTYMLIQINNTTGIIQDCVEVEGVCYQDRVQSTNGSTNTILSAMAATIACLDKVPERNFSGMRECVFDTLERKLPDE